MQKVGEDRREDVKKELRSDMYVYQLPMMNIIVYYEHVAIKNKSSETLRNFIEHLKTPV